MTLFTARHGRPPPPCHSKLENRAGSGRLSTKKPQSGLAARGGDNSELWDAVLGEIPQSSCCEPSAPRKSFTPLNKKSLLALTQGRKMLTPATSPRTPDGRDQGEELVVNVRWDRWTHCRLLFIIWPM